MPNGNVGTFLPAVDTFDGFEDFARQYADMGLRPQALRKLFENLRRTKIYLSEQYQVAIDKQTPHGWRGTLIWHLSIKRIDKEPIMDWRELQAIKSQLCGDEAEALQLFPAESRKVDTSNQYHLWVLMKGPGGRFPRIPVGWQSEMVLDEGATGKAKQRPFATEDKP